MRGIDITNYSVRVKGQDGEYTELSYEMKDSLIEILMARDLQLSGRELLERDELATKIKDCTNGNVLLEEEEWNKLVSAVTTVKGLSRPDVEFTRRILKAEKIEVEEKK